MVAAEGARFDAAVIAVEWPVARVRLVRGDAACAARRLASCRLLL